MFHAIIFVQTALTIHHNTHALRLMFVAHAIDQEFSIKVMFMKFCRLKRQKLNAMKI